MNDGKRVFITGGASGLGRALAETYAKTGWRVCIGDIHDQRGAETLSQLKSFGADCEFLHCDVTKDDDFKAAADWLESTWGGVDLVFNNAGVAAGGRMEDVPIEDWQWLLDINLLGVVRGCKTFTPLLKRQGSGHIVNIASLAGIVYAPRMAPYNAAKAAVVALSETLYGELAHTGVAVSVVCPAFFRTNLIESARNTDPDELRIAERLVNQARRSADEIAAIIVRGVDRGEFRILTDGEGRIAWHLRKWLPFAIFTKLLKLSMKHV